MKIALTGGAGHVGAALVRQLLQSGHSVRALVHRDMAALDGLPVEIVKGNLENYDSLQRLCTGTEVVFHVAGQVSIGEVPEPTLFRINVDGTALLLEACRSAGVRRMIHFSSVHAFHPPPAQEIFDESAAPARDFPYERSKAASQRIVLEANGNDGLETVCLNPTSVLGPWDFKPSLQGRALLDLAARKIPMLLPGGFDWVDNRDVATAAEAAMTHAQAGHAYLIGGRFATLMELANLFADICGQPPPRLTAPFWLVKSIAPLFGAWARVSGQRPLFTREALSHVEKAHPNISCAKAARDLGYRPRPLEETLSDTWKWFTESGF